MKQIVGCANKLKTMGRDPGGLEVRPFGGDERLASIRQNKNELQSVLPVRVPQDFQRLSFERVVRTRDGDPLGEVLTVGSVWRFPSIRFPTSGCSSLYSIASPTAGSSGSSRNG